jgi:hypothetical protein
MGLNKPSIPVRPKIEKRYLIIFAFVLMAPIVFLVFWCLLFAPSSTVMASHNTLPLPYAAPATNSAAGQ